MAGKYITYEERKLIEKFLKENKTYAYISKALNRPPSTIRYEITRVGSKNYTAEKATPINSYYRLEVDEVDKIKGSDLKQKIENLEMQIGILMETIKEMKK